MPVDLWAAPEPLESFPAGSCGQQGPWSLAPCQEWAEAVQEQIWSKHREELDEKSISVCAALVHSLDDLEVIPGGSKQVN